jgi:hypothetical protein
MTRSARLIATALVTVVLFGCVSAQQVATLGTGSPPMSRQVSSSSVCNAGNFTASIQILNAGYTVDFSNYSPPTANVQSGATLASISSQAQTDLANAFNYAPRYFQHFLCNLDGIFIIPGGTASTSPSEFSGSFGYRSYDSSDSGFRYAAISGSLWSSSTSNAEPISSYEQDVLQGLLKKYNTQSWETGVTISPAYLGSGATGVTAAGMTVLAALAHEAGHIRWAEIVSPGGPGMNYDFTRLNQCNVNGTPKDFFANWDYESSPAALEPPGRWRQFGSTDNVAVYAVDHLNAPKLSQFRNASNQALFFTLLNSLYQQAQPWPSFFGANSPDEDFVETYVLRVLTAGGLDNTSSTYLQSLPISIPGYASTVDIPGPFLSGNKAELRRKAACVHAFDPP